MAKEEQILIRITGQDRPGLTANVMSILSAYHAQILDIGQADIHSTPHSYRREEQWTGDEGTPLQSH